MADAHFWIGTFGILLYVSAMWISGINQGLFWRALDADGFLKYPDFVEGLLSARYLYHMRLTGGTLFLLGFVIMTVNLALTIRSGKKVNGEIDVMVRPRPQLISGWAILRGAPVVISVLLVVAAAMFGVASLIHSVLMAIVLLILGAIAYFLAGRKSEEDRSWHRLLEGKPLAFTVLVLFAILAGGIAELIPSIVIEKGKLPELASSSFAQKPYSPLELEGRDIYVREGCYNCHSQMIRPFRFETLRYGEYTRLEESIYDHPFQFGSKRTGPDLQRVGGKYPDLWHYQHLMDPRSTSPGSNMPSYAFLKNRMVDTAGTEGKLLVMWKLGVPYAAEDIENGVETLRSQGQLIAAELLESGGVTVDPESDMVALIGYLQRLGRGPQPTAPEPILSEEE
jgi:cytochrome c oxidase cbb3-type subunit I/II